MTELKFVYWFAYYNTDSPSVRYRAAYPLAHFKSNYNINYALILPGYSGKRILHFTYFYLSALFFRKKNALIVIQRVHSNFIYSRLLKLLVTLRPKGTVYDLDDADYLYFPAKSIYYFAQNCEYISAGSTAIAEHLRPLNPKIIHLTSPTPDLGVVKSKRNEIFTIGWIGGFGGDHKESLIDLVFPALKQLNFPCRFVIMGVTKAEDSSFIFDYFKSDTHVKIDLPVTIDWHNERSIQEKISTFDLGIATLVDNEIQRSKSGIKAKQYLNNGVPVLGTNLPENDWVIKDGINGYFCSSTEDYLKRIIEFKQMSFEEYYRFSKNSVLSNVNFNHTHYYHKFTELFA